MLPKFYNRHFKKSLRLYWWRYEYPNKLNFGDEITPAIIERMFGRRTTWSPPDECEMAGAGSIIEILLASKGQNRPTVWGSGFIKKDTSTISAGDFNIIALRGRSSLARVSAKTESNISLGDPGLLADCLLSSMPPKKYRLGVVPHYVDTESSIVKELAAQSGVKIIDVLDSPEKVVQNIAACEAVVSSSLHGLIVADSVGTPNAHLKLSDKLTGGLYKFEDYYSVFNDSSGHLIIRSDDVAGKTASAIEDDVKQLYRAPSSLDSVKQGLVESFPS
jgi:pyruvyltransferase